MAAFFLGGWLYVGLELLWRGRSHVSMFAAGGLSLSLIGTLEEAKPDLPMPLRVLAGTGIITSVELATGLIANRRHHIWDYRSMPGNYRGQICPQFCLLWMPVAWIAGGFYRRLAQCLNTEK